MSERVEFSMANPDRLWLDRVQVHGSELLDALKQLVKVTERDTPLMDAERVIHRAHALINKLDGKEPTT